MIDPNIQSSSPRLLRVMAARPQLFVCGALGLMVALFTPMSVLETQLTRTIVGWNVGACLYLLLAAHTMLWSTHERMRQRAMRHGEGKRIVLAFVVLAALVSLGAIVAEMAVAKDMHGFERNVHVALAILTLLSSWAFTHVMYALHYAHDFYLAQSQGREGGLDFPGSTKPDYSDFLYFALIIGTSAQTADVSVTSRALRRTLTLHCVLAFFFNATLIALTINIVSGML